MKWISFAVLAWSASSFGLDLYHIQGNCAANCTAKCPMVLAICQSTLGDPDVIDCFNKCVKFAADNSGSPDNVVQQVTGGGVVATGPGTNCRLECGNQAFNPDGTPGMQQCHPVCQGTMPTSTVAQQDLELNRVSNCKQYCYNTPSGQKCVQHCGTDAEPAFGWDCRPSADRQRQICNPSSGVVSHPAPPYPWEGPAVKEADVGRVLPNQTVERQAVAADTKQVFADAKDAANKARQLSEALMKAPPSQVHQYVEDKNWVEAPLPTVAPDF